MATRVDEEFTTEDLVRELQAHQQPIIERQEGGITHQEWAIAQGVSDTAGRNQLKKMMAEGLLTREWQMCGDGNRRYVYYKK
jgi:uncharacterized phage protein gp47/JayE